MMVGLPILRPSPFWNATGLPQQKILHDKLPVQFFQRSFDVPDSVKADKIESKL
jgi:hypothetical protein